MSSGPWIRACKRCRTPVRNRQELSATGLCLNCGAAILRDNVTQLVEHRGPRFDYWRRRCREAFLNAPLDAPRVRG